MNSVNDSIHNDKNSIKNNLSVNKTSYNYNYASSKNLTYRELNVML